MNDIEKPVCKLIGEDGNVFAIIGAVMRALKKANLRDRAEEFSRHAREAKNYGNVLNLCHEYVTVR